MERVVSHNGGLWVYWGVRDVAGDAQTTTAADRRDGTKAKLMLKIGKAIDERSLTQTVQFLEDLNPSPVPHHRQNTQQYEEEDHHQREKTIARDTLFVAQRTQALQASGGEITHQLGIGRRGSAEMVSQSR